MSPSLLQEGPPSFTPTCLLLDLDDTLYQVEEIPDIVRRNIQGMPLPNVNRALGISSATMMMMLIREGTSIRSVLECYHDFHLAGD